MLTVAVSTVQVLLANYLGATYFYESGTHPHLNDFVPYYAAASLGRHCLISHECIYSPALQAHFADLALAPQSLTHQFTLQYPPFTFAWLMPLAVFNLQNAFLVLNAASCLALLASLLILARMTKNPILVQILIFAGAAASFPVLKCLEQGQLSTIVLLALTAFWYFMREKRYYAAALVIAIGVVKIQYLPFIGLVGMIVGGRKFIVGLAASYAGLALLCLTLFGPDAISAYPRAILNGETVGLVEHRYMSNILGQVLALTGNLRVASIVSMGCFAAGLAFIAYLWQGWYKKHFQQSGAFEACAAITSLIMPVASPHTFTYDYVFYIVAVSFILMWLRQHSAETTIKLTARVFLVAIFLLPFATWIFELAFANVAAPLPRGMPITGLLMAIFFFRAMKKVPAVT